MVEDLGKVMDNAAKKIQPPKAGDRRKDFPFDQVFNGETREEVVPTVAVQVAVLVVRFLKQEGVIAASRQNAASKELDIEKQEESTIK